MKKIIFIITFTIIATSPLLYTQQNENIDPWKFIEYKLIISPQSLNKKDHFFNFIFSSLIGILNVFRVKNELIRKNDNYTSQYCRFTLASMFSASIVYGIIDILAQQIVDAQTIHSFITQWPEYKKYTPAQLQPIFDATYIMYLSEVNIKKYQNYVEGTLIIAREHIEAHFPETYGGKGNYRKYVTRKILNFAPFKMIVNTLKLVV